jgi:hypothetical protein
LKTESKERLDKILYKVLSVENIETFANDALEDILELIDYLLREYKTNPNLSGDLSLDVQQQEDDVCEKLGLPNISQILNQIEIVKSRIDSLKVFIENSTNLSEEIITPPDQLNESGILQGEGGFEDKKIIPRLLTLMYILETDFEIDIKDESRVHLTEGKIDDQMIRKSPYVRVYIPELNRVVYVCDEEENVTYVFDVKKLIGLEISIDDLDVDGKQDKNSLIERFPGVGIRLKQTTRWRNRISEYLEEEIFYENKKIENIEPRSEFKSREILSYSDFCESARDAYYMIPEDERLNAINVWYRSEYKKHAGWPSLTMLKQKYSDYGFIDLHSILGVENMHKKKYLAYNEFERELLESFGVSFPDRPDEVGLWNWYESEYKKHAGWPSLPQSFYRKDGMINLHSVLSLNNGREKNKFLSYNDLKREVSLLYFSLPESERPVNISKWYSLERRKGHTNWPSAPYQFYKEDWLSWSNLVDEFRK